MLWFDIRSVKNVLQESTKVLCTLPCLKLLWESMPVKTKTEIAILVLAVAVAKVLVVVVVVDDVVVVVS